MAYRPISSLRAHAPHLKLAAALLGALLCAPLPGPAAAQVKESPAPQFLYVQTAKAVSYGDGVLTLREVSPLTVFFSDRPKRIVGHVRNDLFFREWAAGHNSFKSDPPNAVLVAFDEKSHPTSTVVVLDHPQVDGNNISYAVRALNGTLPSTGAEGSLFIDASSGYCDPGYDIGDPGYPCWAQKAFAGNAP